jgi:hypothetical protein
MFAIDSLMRGGSAPHRTHCAAGGSADQRRLILGHARTSGQEKPRHDQCQFISIHPSLLEF